MIIHKKTISCITILSTLVFATMVVAANKGTDNTLTRLKADDLKVVQAGEKIYQSYCAGCHGVYLEGQPNWRSRGPDGRLPAPPHDASGHTWHHADDLLFEITKYGASVVIGDASYETNMPAYESLLTDDEIIAVLSFIKNSWPAEQRQWQEEVNGIQTDSTPDNSSGSGFLDKFFK